LEAENEKLSHELSHLRSVLEQKTTTSQRALGDMVENYQAAEKARMDTLHEKETIVSELNALKNRLAMSDAKRVDLEKNLAESETLRKELMKRVAHFENSARKALSFASKLFLKSLVLCYYY
uniref:HOOK domain-containing protein n=1 Tax=Gongylonema pulchrum TaxID=637853 RepID=A0A183EUA8_9BILA